MGNVYAGYSTRFRQFDKDLNLNWELTQGMRGITVTSDDFVFAIIGSYIYRKYTSEGSLEYGLSSDQSSHMLSRLIPGETEYYYYSIWGTNLYKIDLRLTDGHDPGEFFSIPEDVAVWNITLPASGYNDGFVRDGKLFLFAFSGINTRNFLEIEFDGSEINEKNDGYFRLLIDDEGYFYTTLSGNIAKFEDPNLNWWNDAIWEASVTGADTIFAFLDFDNNWEMNAVVAHSAIPDVVKVDKDGIITHQFDRENLNVPDFSAAYTLNNLWYIGYNDHSIRSYNLQGTELNSYPQQVTEQIHEIVSEPGLHMDGFWDDITAYSETLTIGSAILTGIIDDYQLPVPVLSGQQENGFIRLNWEV